MSGVAPRRGRRTEPQATPFRLRGVAVTPTGEEPLEGAFETGHPLAKVADPLADEVETLVDTLQISTKPRA